MNKKLNKSDWIILSVIFGITIILNCIDYYREENELIEYLVDFPTSTFFSIVMILTFIQVLVPKFLIEKKRFLSFAILSLILLISLGTLDKIIGRFSAGGSLKGISNVFLYLQNGLYNATGMIGLPLGILLMKKFYEGQAVIAKTKQEQKENELKLLRSQIDPHFLFNNLKHIRFTY